MGYTYGGDATLGISFNVNTPKPLDIRAVVNSTKDLYEIPSDNAYIGMTVANIADGNIYMLIDKSNINNKTGWRASYESIQIIACSALEYKTWLDNTNINGEMFSPKEESIPFIHSNTYYYIYEETGYVGKDEEGNSVILENQYYITKQWIEEALATKANTGITDDLYYNIANLRNDLENQSNNLKENYSTSIQIETNYYKKEYIDQNVYFKSDVYTKEEIDNLFVTKESLRGDSLGDDDFVFVTQTKYEKDQTQLQEQLNSKVSTDDDAKLNSLTTDSIKSENSLNIEAGEVTINGEAVLVKSSVDNHVTLSSEAYEQLEDKDEHTYYYVYDDNIKDGWVLRSTLNNYYTIEQITPLLNSLQNQINALTDRITALES